MSKLGNFKARRSLAKVNLEHGLRRVNDFYWGALAATRYARDQKRIARFGTFVARNPDFRRQGRLRHANLPTLLQSTEDELPKTGIITLFSYLEPYLRDLCLSAVLSNPGTLVRALGGIDGETIADNAIHLALVEALAAQTIEGWLKGPYVERFAQIRGALGLPAAITGPVVTTLDEYYAKRNCLVHRAGVIDARAKRSFPDDERNPVGGHVVADWSDYLRLHKAVHDLSDHLDAHVMANHIKNAESLRLIYRLHADGPNWTAKDITREVFNRGLDRISRNTIASLLGVAEA